MVPYIRYTIYEKLAVETKSLGGTVFPLAESAEYLCLLHGRKQKIKLNISERT